MSITSPADNSTVKGNVLISADASDDQGVAKVKFYVGGNVVAESLSAPYPYTWNSGEYPSGAYNLWAEAVDNTGQSSIHGINVTADNRNLQLLAPAQAPVNNTFTVPVQVNNAVDLYAGELVIEFDPEKLSFISARGNVVDGKQFQVFTTNLVKPGLVKVPFLLFGQQQGLTCNQATVATLTLKAVGAGPGKFTLTTDSSLVNSAMERQYLTSDNNYSVDITGQVGGLSNQELPNVTPGQTGTVGSQSVIGYGTLTGQVTGYAVAGAQVELICDHAGEKFYQTTCDANGQFSLQNLPAETYFARAAPAANCVSDLKEVAVPANGSVNIEIGVSKSDLNGDGESDILDLAILSINYGRNVTGIANGDLNGNKLVDLSDLGFLADGYGMGKPDYSAEIVSHTVPDTMIAGHTAEATITVKNTGRKTWPGNGIFLLSSGYKGNFQGDYLLPAEVHPGQEKTFSLTLTAPQMMGSCEVNWRMQNSYGGLWFGKSLTKNITVTAADISLTTSVNSSTNIVTINGNVTSGAGKQLAIEVFNPEQNIENIGQLACDSSGNFAYSFKLKSLVQGTYQVIVGGENIAIPGITTFDYISSSQVNPITPTVPSSTKPVTKTVIFKINKIAIPNATALVPDAQFEAAVNVTNNSTVDKQNILISVALFDPDGALEDFVAIGSELSAGETGESCGGFLLPHNVAGYKASVFVWEGSDFKETSLVPLSPVVSIPEVIVNSVSGSTYEIDSTTSSTSSIWDIIEKLNSTQKDSETGISTLSNPISVVTEFTPSYLEPNT